MQDPMECFQGIVFNIRVNQEIGVNDTPSELSE